ncbi:hypothetical protein B4Q13_20335 [Lacticaseibacillus rhamnosus]
MEIAVALLLVVVAEMPEASTPAPEAPIWLELSIVIKPEPDVARMPEFRLPKMPIVPDAVVVTLTRPAPEEWTPPEAEPFDEDGPDWMPGLSAEEERRAVTDLAMQQLTERAIGKVRPVDTLLTPLDLSQRFTQRLGRTQFNKPLDLPNAGLGRTTDHGSRFFDQPIRIAYFLSNHVSLRHIPVRFTNLRQSRETNCG